jgi:pyrimidine operon attenuation protein/uracil phosphoribosyltransferase
MDSNSIVLDQQQIKQKIERLAFEIIENTFETKKVYVAGIAGNGFLFAERLIEQLSQQSDQEFLLFKVEISKDAPLSEDIVFSIDRSVLEGATVVLVDDVINSGRTMIYAVRELLENKLSHLKVVTLVNRTHRRFPVQADFVGVNLSTTIQDNIIVELGDKDVAYLE